MKGTLSVNVVFLLLGLIFALPGTLEAQIISDIANTKHNFSVSSPGTVKATAENELCVFCHTPHAATTADAPLWNRSISNTATYDYYTSSSMDATGLGQPNGKSKICLSCHDGTIAIGSVNVLNGAETDKDGTTEEITMTGTNGDGTMPAGSGASTGFTRRLGSDLTNDHPVSFTYDSVTSSNDGELFDPSTASHIGDLATGGGGVINLDSGRLQCTTCHDPHVRNAALSVSGKFLRLNRFQEGTVSDGSFSVSNDIVCLACHTKDGWTNSAHANPNVANELYASSAAALREFPANMPVWQGSCLNCHDTHTVEGATRLLREGTNSAVSPKLGGSSAQEETCYQCHSNDGGTLQGQGGVSFAVPDIKTDFNLIYHMPIAQQPEVHDIGTAGLLQDGADMIESTNLLGMGAPGNRHVECTDCHNPHRVIKNDRFNDNSASPDSAGTHFHGEPHSNIISGVLKGSWGVEPSYSSGTFMSNASSFTVKRGNPSVGASTAVTNSYVTREYQICLKCHSSYAYGTTPPSLTGANGGSPPGTNGLTDYTDQAMEFQPFDKGKAAIDGNYRSYHPVMDSTGRTVLDRGAEGTAWLAPWSNNVGNQTMYCSDCHGSDNGLVANVEPTGGTDGEPWGPHGSDKPFILKGTWDTTVGDSGTTGGGVLCFKCHNENTYAGGGKGSGFFDNDSRDDLHAYHSDKINFKCMYCHVAVPHGWKNRSFLVNLNDVGPEAGLPAGTQVRNDSSAPYYAAPYYQRAVLKVKSWPTSPKTWWETKCGSSGPPGNGQTGRDWMRDSSENCEGSP